MRRHVEKVLGYFARGEGRGRGHRRRRERGAAGGNYVEPTVFTGARNDMRIAQEEIFGPVLTVIPFDDEARSAADRERERYGLPAYLWTTTSAERTGSRRLDAGMIWVNSENNRHLPSPFGGMKASGIGRDGGDYSFDFYMETKNICIALGTHRVPTLGQMSLYHVQKLLYQLNRDSHVRQRFDEEPSELLGEYRLTNEERTA